VSILILDCHPCTRTKKSLATWAKKYDTATRVSCEEGRCRIAHVRNQCVVAKISCKKECFLLSNTTVFLQRQTDQQRAAVPTREPASSTVLWCVSGALLCLCSHQLVQVHRKRLYYGGMDRSIKIQHLPSYSPTNYIVRLRSCLFTSMII